MDEIIYELQPHEKYVLDRDNPDADERAALDPDSAAMLARGRAFKDAVRKRVKQEFTVDELVRIGQLESDMENDFVRR